jgi:hypothetical protein
MLFSWGLITKVVKKVLFFNLEIYKAVLIKVFINAKKQVPGLQNRAKYLKLTRLNRALKSLVYAMNPNSQKEDEMHPTDCCICINTIAPFQALFLGPCSHCFHYKCVTPLLGAGFMFQCPVCRQVANLEASVAEPEDFVKEAVYDEIESTDGDDDAMAIDGPSILPGTLIEDQGPMDRGATLRRSNEILAPVNSMHIRENSAPMDIPSTAVNVEHAAHFAQSPNTPLNNSHMPARMDRTASNSTGELMNMDEVSPGFGALQKIISAATNGDRSALQQETQRYAERIRHLLESTLGADQDVQSQVMSVLLGSVPGQNQGPNNSA